MDPLGCRWTTHIEPFYLSNSLIRPRQCPARIERYRAWAVFMVARRARGCLSARTKIENRQAIARRSAADIAT
jgi:hypothetical protein